MDFLILFSFFITPGFAAAPPVKNDLASLSTPGLTLIRIYKASVSSQEIMWVPDNGTFFNPNPAASLIKRVCISSNLPACAFGATNGTWIAAYNNTNHGCSTISPPLVFNIGFCCLSLDDCALLDGPFALRTRFTEVAKAHLHDLPNGALNLTKSSGNVSHINVPTNGTTFSFGAAGSHISQVCLGTGIGACMFQAADGMAYTAWAFGGCVNVDPTKGLDNGFCCKDLYNCGTFNLPRSVRDVSLQTRGKVVNNSLAILFEGPPDIAAWELVLTNLVGFNVTDHVSWSVGQVCLMVSNQSTESFANDTDLSHSQRLLFVRSLLWMDQLMLLSVARMAIAPLSVLLRSSLMVAVAMHGTNAMHPQSRPSAKP
jgi:hypothetical protein